ncbi:hypothetical protein ACHAPJ_003138 [Fusarium lateritium]
MPETATGPATRTASASTTAADETTATLTRRIEELESMLRKQNDVNSATAQVPVNGQPSQNMHVELPQLYQTDSLALLNSILDPPGIFPSTLPFNIPPMVQESHFDWPAPTSDQVDDDPLTIPIGHLTPTSSLFALEPIQKLIGEYPEDFFYRIECTREFVPEDMSGSFQECLLMLNTNHSHTTTLLSAFFTEIHPHFPLIDKNDFLSFFESTMIARTNETDVALCLTILALGRLACNRQACSPGQYTGDDGVDYFSLAYRILTTKWVTSFGVDLSLASGLVYAAIYLCYLERPLHAWRLVHMASTKLQLIASR